LLAKNVPYNEIERLGNKTSILKADIEATELWLIENARFAEALTGH
jgi:hypothetical protein